MDLFGGFRNDKHLDDMMKSINERLKKFGFESFNFDFDMKMESGIDIKMVSGQKQLTPVKMVQLTLLP